MRDMLLGSRVTLQSDMKVTSQRRKYMRSSLKRSFYVERRSVERGSMSILNPLALNYHFGQASATPERKRASEIIGQPPHPTVKNHVVNEEGTDNVTSEASFRDVLGVHFRNGKGTIGNLRRDQRQVGGKWEVPQIFFLKSPQTGGSPGVFSPERTKAVVKWRFIRKKKALTGASQRGS